MASTDSISHKVYGKLHLARLTGEPVCFPLVKRITQFGRHSTSDVRIYDATVSKVHAELVCLSEEERAKEGTDATARLTVHSANGIIVSSKIWQRGQDVPVYDGDVIDISGRRFTFEDASQTDERVVVHVSACLPLASGSTNEQIIPTYLQMHCLEPKVGHTSATAHVAGSRRSD